MRTKKGFCKITAVVFTIVSILAGTFAINIASLEVKAGDDYAYSQDGMVGRLEMQEQCALEAEEHTADCFDEKQSGENSEVFISYEKNYASQRTDNFTTRKMIDVSFWQGDINWNEVKSSGVEGVFIRVGYRGQDGVLYEDSKYREYMQGASNVGLKIGAYIYSEAISEAEAIEEANFLVDRCYSYNISLPLVMDYEFCGGTRAAGCRLHNAMLSGQDVATRTAIINAFCNQVARCGYTACLYANKYTLETYIDAGAVANNHKIWVAQYKLVNGEQYHDYPFDASSYAGINDFWQFTSEGTSIRGVSSTYVDMDYWYDDGSIFGKNYSLVFDANYYASHNPDVVAAFGTDPALLLNHFVTCGMNEKRNGNDSFDLFSYFMIYSDLRDAFGSNWRAYFDHYITRGYYEGRVTKLGQVANANAMYRLYNPNSGEHFYTANSAEVFNVFEAGWNCEGIGWYAPASGADVYRVYNPNAGDHHYTTNYAEVENVVNYGWRYEGVGWKSGGNVPLYRAYNPNATAGAHHFTTNYNEIQNICSLGWRDEGIGWYAVK